MIDAKLKVPEPRYFDGNRKQFADWWRAMAFYLKFNKIAAADEKVIMILAHLRGDTAGAFAQMELERLNQKDDTIDWKRWETNFKKLFSNDTLQSNAKWIIKSFKQGKKHTTDFLIEFETLKIRAQVNDAHAKFLLKRNTYHDTIKAILGYPPDNIPTSYEEWKKAILSVGQGYESTEICQDTHTGSGITYGGNGQPMEIERIEGRKTLKCYACCKLGHIAKNCQNPKKPKCFTCGCFGHMAN
ncbi:hypothetical protein D9756_004486 [Leucocoprinus leucothites]|uniref:CCHC-type domain-containing protein n=1 Tax=Leucocoprinus leucothites TaxID=201217 RepID=A0A8H5GA15_9AGAR|nr:hypothetical protein D9756_004486 [Leucoagaricus leucothites]